MAHLRAQRRTADLNLAPGYPVLAAARRAGLEVRIGSSHELRIRIRSPASSSDPGNRHARLLAALGSRRAATDRCGSQHYRWRIVTDRRRARTVIPALACGFPMILPDLYPSDVQAGGGSLDLTRKRSQVQTLSRPPGTTYLQMPRLGPAPVGRGGTGQARAVMISGSHSVGRWFESTHLR